MQNMLVSWKACRKKSPKPFCNMDWGYDLLRNHFIGVPMRISKLVGRYREAWCQKIEHQAGNKKRVCSPEISPQAPNHCGCKTSGWHLRSKDIPPLWKVRAHLYSQEELSVVCSIGVPDLVAVWGTILWRWSHHGSSGQAEMEGTIFSRYEQRWLCSLFLRLLLSKNKHTICVFACSRILDVLQILLVGEFGSQAL